MHSAESFPIFFSNADRGLNLRTASSPGDIRIVANFCIGQDVWLMSRYEHVDGVSHRTRSTREFEETDVETSGQDLYTEATIDDHIVCTIKYLLPTILFACAWNVILDGWTTGCHLAGRDPAKTTTCVYGLEVSQGPHGNEDYRLCCLIERRNEVELTQIMQSNGWL